MEHAQLDTLSRWLGVHSSTDLKSLEAAVLSAVALSLPQHVSDELGSRGQFFNLVSGGLLGPPEAAKQVLNQAAQFAVSGRAKELLAECAGSCESEQNEGKKASTSEVDVDSSSRNWLDESQAGFGLFIIASISRASQTYLPDIPGLQLAVGLEVLLLIVCMLNSSKRGSRSPILPLEGPKKLLLLGTLFVLELLALVKQALHLDGTPGEGLFSLGSCVVGMFIVLLTSGEPFVFKVISQVAVLWTFLIGAYLPCLLKGVGGDEACKLPVCNLMGLTLCLTLSGLLSSAARYQRRKNVHFKWRTKDGTISSKMAY